MKPIKITIAGRWLERLIAATREDGMTDEIAWENAQQQTVRIIKKLVERGEALASTEEEMIDHVLRNDGRANGIITIGTTTTEYDELQDQRRLPDAGYAKAPDRPLAETGNPRMGQGYTEGGETGNPGPVLDYLALPPQPQKGGLAYTSRRTDSKELDRSNGDDEERLPADWREKAARSMGLNLRRRGGRSGNVQTGDTEARSLRGDVLPPNGEDTTQTMGYPPSPQGVRRGPSSLPVTRDSAGYRANPEDYNILDNGMAVAKSDYQKRMEALERRYSQGNFDKTPTMNDNEY